MIHIDSASFAKVLHDWNLRLLIPTHKVSGLYSPAFLGKYLKALEHLKKLSIADFFSNFNTLEKDGVNRFREKADNELKTD